MRLKRFMAAFVAASMVAAIAPEAAMAARVATGGQVTYYVLHSSDNTLKPSMTANLSYKYNKKGNKVSESADYSSVPAVATQPAEWLGRTDTTYKWKKKRITKITTVDQDVDYDEVYNAATDDYDYVKKVVTTSDTTKKKYKKSGLKRVKTFDQAGRLTSDIVYSQLKKGRKSSFYGVTYSYDSTTGAADGKRLSTAGIATFDKKGRIVKTVTANTTTTQKYWKNGNLKKLVVKYDGGDGEAYKEITKYNKNGYPKSSVKSGTWYSSQAKAVIGQTSTTTYSYTMQKKCPVSAVVTVDNNYRAEYTFTTFKKVKKTLNVDSMGNYIGVGPF